MGLDYLTFLEHVRDIDYPVMWRFFLLALCRIGPIAGLAPFLGAKIIPVSARAAIAISLVIVFMPSILMTAEKSYISDPAFVGYAFKEIIIGFVIGYFSAVPFYIAQSAGIYIDYMRGSSMLMAQDPNLQAQASPIGIMFNYYLIVMFYALDGPLLFFDAIGTSFEAFPIDAFVNPLFFNLNNPFWQTAISIAGQIFALSIQLAAPALVAILMAETFLGIANRLAPQVQIAFLGMALKSLLGLTLLWAGWFIILKQSSKISIDWMHMMQKTLLKLPYTK